LDSALLVLRLVVGLYLFGHGAQKLFGWFGGPGLQQATGFMRMLGFRPPLVAALLGSTAETVGGVLVVLGLLGPLGPLAIAATMVVAFVPHWSKGIWGQKGGFEQPLTNLAAAVTLALAGPGRYSLDALFGVALLEPRTLVTAAIVAALGVAGVIAIRKPQSAAGASQQHASAA